MRVVSLDELKLNAHCNSYRDCMRDDPSDCENCSNYVVEWRDIIDYVDSYEMEEG